MMETFKGDYRILRVVMASSDPISTLHDIRVGKYSIRTFLDMLEMLDVKDTIDEEASTRRRQKQQQEQKALARGR